MAGINGATVYVCEMHQPPRSGHYGDTGSWHVVGVLADEDDAAEWAEGDDNGRRYSERTVGVVAEHP